MRIMQFRGARSCLAGLIAAMAVFATGATPACAGHWIISYDGKGAEAGYLYKETNDSHGDVWHRSYWHRPWTPGELAAWINPYPLASAPEGYTAWSRTAGIGWAVLTWVHDGQNDTSLPPQRIYLVEVSRAQAIRHSENPAAGELHHEVTTGLGGEEVLQQPPDDPGYVKVASCVTILGNSARQSVVRLFSRRLVAEMSASTPPAPGSTSGYGHGVNLSNTNSYSVGALTLTIGVRRLGTDDTFGGNITIAAGGENSYEHEVEVQISMGAAIANVPVAALPSPDLVDANGVAVKGTFTRRSGGVTNNEGKAILGTFRSSDKTRTVTLRLPPDTAAGFAYADLPDSVGPQTPPSSATVQQLWDRAGQWRMGLNGERPWDSGLAVTDDASPQTVVFKPKLSVGPDVSITGHTMRFMVTRVKVQQCDAAGNLTERIYLRASKYAQPDDVAAVVAPDQVNSYAIFDATNGYAEVEDSGQGTYRGSLSFPQTAAGMVEDVNIVAEDQGTYFQP